MITISLFNAVPIGNASDVIVDTKYGFIIESGGGHLEKQIRNHFKDLFMGNSELSKSFYSSWRDLSELSDEQIMFDKIKHYVSSQISLITGDELFIPNEVINVPDDAPKLKFTVIKALSDDQLIERCLELLRSGIAMDKETIEDILAVLDDCSYTFTSLDQVKNKEAMTLISTRFNVYPAEPIDVLRCLVFKATNDTLLIKNDHVINTIVNSRIMIQQAVDSIGAERMAEIFNRFKPLFMAFKKANKANVKAVNKISKLSKVKHKPLPQNALSVATSALITDDNRHWLQNATVFALLSALNAVKLAQSDRENFVYRIRNGKSYVTEGKKDYSESLLASNYQAITDELKTRIAAGARNVFIPDNIEYALPTSAKSFIGNVPEGTCFTGKKLAVGVYWENSWGARDLDLSSINVEKIGWNSYYRGNTGITYSGDIVSAPNGAVEYLNCTNDHGKMMPTIVMLNVFSGEIGCSYNIIIGESSKVNQAFMMDSKNLVFSQSVKSVSKQMLTGIVSPTDDGRVAYYLYNLGGGNARVSGGGVLSDIQRMALYEKATKSLTFNQLLVDLGFNMVDDASDADIDLSIEKLSKDTFIQLLTENDK